MKEKFKNYVKENISRPGIKELMDWLETTDFYTAPASTMFHNSFEGGLVEHSINVFECLSKLGNISGFSKESVAIVSLFHDLCKVNTTIVSTRNVKNEITGQWEKQPFYKIENKFPYGHGEKSVYLILKHMNLTDEEAMAINWHMGGFDERSSGYDLSNAFNMNRLAVELHIADLRATFEIENKKN